MYCPKCPAQLFGQNRYTQQDKTDSWCSVTFTKTLQEWDSNVHIPAQIASICCSVFLLDMIQKLRFTMTMSTKSQ